MTWDKRQELSHWPIDNSRDNPYTVQTESLIKKRLIMQLIILIGAVFFGAYYNDKVFPVANTVMLHLGNLFHDLVRIIT